MHSTFSNSLTPQAKKMLFELQSMGITNEAILTAISMVPRDRFIDQALAHQAYDNLALPIGSGQTISQPYIVAKMTELLALKTNDKVLEIGTGSGYQTAVLAKLVSQVYTVERIKSLQWAAYRRLQSIDIYNISSKHGDGWEGWKSHAPFNGIIVTAAASQIPITLLHQLADGGRLVIPVGEDSQLLKLITRHGDTFKVKQIETVKFVPLIQGELS
ncbi:protein-L-isoaspartate(D-aspartate) O-methyltransferase [Thorsellia anophelis]|uniref:Protein-L-isoaspartate O-methyltransferase n=1 Tax=Thorsellia anophelis DSM 18579 TaxID=1123402 RepID=A0A1I0CA50_9GAMM|nr:protein-L-isoaspartate(D-aspartate) O-methyltransferase [Thorsellia anophelis]SET16351.1 protein-L-isoaspartate(D-aspartate) O-methyltransferase [Thorsellia anophelis DSM 18579]